MSGVATGTLYLVGVGPGDPELLTLKAARVISAAPVVAFPKTESGTTMALDIVREHIAPMAVLEPISIPMTIRMPNGEFASKHENYVAAAAILAEHLVAQRDVVYLCEGDPLFYGTSIYVGTELWNRFPVIVVPGITSMNAAAAAIPFPLVARLESLTVLTGPLPDEVLLPEIDKVGSVVILKVGRHYDRLRALLERTGRAEWSWLVENVGGKDQRIIRVRDAEPGPKPYFSLLLCYSGAEFWLE